MPLHRDIFWIGRQWAVTGSGMQAINQKLGGEFDIPIDRLWDKDLLDHLGQQKWFNPDDFAKGLTVARGRFPQPPPKPAPPPTTIEKLLQTQEAIAIPKATAPPIDAAPKPPVAPPPPLIAESARTEATLSFFRISLTGHPARLLRVWRVRRRSGA
jgi:hypothetical protein